MLGASGKKLKIFTTTIYCVFPNFPKCSFFVNLEVKMGAPVKRLSMLVKVFLPETA